MAELLTVEGVNDKKALQRLLDKRDEELHLKLQRTKGYAELVRLRAAAMLLLQAVHADMTALVRLHDADADVSAVIYGVARDEQAAGLDYRHLPYLTEDAALYAREYTDRIKKAEARGKRAADEATRERLSFAVDVGLISPVARTVPTVLFGDPKALRLALSHAVNTAIAGGRAKVIHLTTGNLYTTPTAKPLPANEWQGQYSHFHRFVEPGTDLLVCDDVFCASQLPPHPKRRQQPQREPNPDRAARVVRRVRGMGRAQNVAVLLGVPTDGKDVVANYRDVRESAYTYTASIVDGQLVVQDADWTKSVTIPIRRVA